jgi:hypothetical protein
VKTIISRFSNFREDIIKILKEESKLEDEARK